MSAVLTRGRACGGDRRQAQELPARRTLTEAGCLSLGVVLLMWTLAPLYNMVMVALQSHNDVFTTDIWPAQPSAYSFWIVFTEGYWYLEYFWHQYANSIYIGVWTVFLTLFVGSLVSFSIGRMRHHARLAADQCRAADLSDAGVIPGDPVLSDDADLRARQQCLVDHRGRGDLCDPVRDLHLPAIRTKHSLGARRGGADRRGLADTGLFPHLSAD